MERAVVLTQGGGQPQASPALGDLVAQYSTILASQVSISPFAIRTSSCGQICHTLQQSPGQRSLQTDFVGPVEWVQFSQL